jgi:hypothetical protein
MAGLSRQCEFGVAGGKVTLGDASCTLGIGVSTLGGVVQFSCVPHSALGT